MAIASVVACMWRSCRQLLRGHICSSAVLGLRRGSRLVLLRLWLLRQLVVLESGGLIVVAVAGRVLVRAGLHSELFFQDSDWHSTHAIEDHSTYFSRLSWCIWMNIHWADPLL